MEVHNFSYEETLTRIQQVVGEIESGTINMDELPEKVKEISELVNQCKKYLQKVEGQVDDLFPED